MRDGPGSDLEEPPCLLCGEDEPEDFLHSGVQLAPTSDESFRFVRCRSCGLVYLHPRPATPTMARYYPPAYLPHREAEAWGRWAPLVRRSQARMDRKRVAWVLRRRRVPPGTPVLDVGCGRPTFLETLRVRTGAFAVGLDTSDAGWRDGGAAWSGLHLVRGELSGSGDRLEAIAPGPYQVITLWHALEHDPRPAATLRRLRRLAAPDALLVVEVPDLDSLSARLHGAAWAGLHTPRHTAAYTPRTLKRMLSRGGWGVESHLRRGTLDPYLLWWLGRRIGLHDPLTGSLEKRFPGFVAGKIAATPLTMLQRWLPLGVQTALARPARPGSVARGGQSQ